MNVESSILARRAAVHAALGEEHRLAMIDALRLSDLSPGELQEMTGLSSNLVAFHLDVLEDAGLVERRPSQGDSRRRYVTLAEPFPPAELVPGLSASTVAFVCTANSARSQFASFLWANRTGLVPLSAGTEPADRVHPLAVAVAARHGIDLSRVTPRLLDHLDIVPDLVVSVCDRAKESGVGSDVPSLHWSVPDPAAGGEQDFENAFQQIAARVERLATTVKAKE